MKPARLPGIRVLFVLPTFGRGGAERQAFLLGRRLQEEEGAEVRFVSLAPPGVATTLVPDLDRHELAWEHFTLRGAERQRLQQARDLWRFVAFLRRVEPDVVLPYCMYPNIVSALTWKLGRARACIWNQRDEGRSRVVRWAERLALGQVRTYLSNSGHGAAFLTDVLAVPSERVQVVHNGIEPTPTANAVDWRQRMQISPDAFVACMVANLHGFKDHETLVAAWRQVVDRLEAHARPAHLLFAGAHGDRAASVTEQVQRFDLTNRIHFLGVVDDVPGLLAAVDLAVFSSFNEGLPNAVLEAMAAERAVVATDYPGIREAVGVEGQALLAAPRDAADLADKIVMMAEDATLRRTHAVHGRQRVETQFTIDRMVSSTVDAIRQELMMDPLPAQPREHTID